MPYLLAVNRTIRGKLPKDATPDDWRRFNDAFVTQELTPAEIADEIRAGHAIAADHGNRRRKVANWRRAQHIGIDLDNGALSWDDIVSMPLVEDHAAIVHTTASHRPDNPRYRVLFLLEDVIDNPDSYGYVVSCLLRAFETADPLCKDASRLFFGAPDCSLLLQSANRLTSEDIANIVTAWPSEAIVAAARGDLITPDDPGDFEDDRAPRQIGFRVPTPATSAGDIIPPGQVSPRRLTAHSEALLDKIRHALDGTKWATLRDVSITLGGYVAAGYYTRDDIERRLRGAIETRRATVGSMPAAYQTIDIGLAYGAIRGALWYTREDDRRASSHDPPRAGRGDLRRRLVDDRLAELEAAINAADMTTAGNLADLIAEYDHLRTSMV
jgi:hypothetical protein